MTGFKSKLKAKMNKNKASRVLVLGSEGQIGSALVPYLRKRGFEVHDYDIERDASQDLRRRNNPELETSMKDCDFVFFLAFDVGGSHYLEKYQDSPEFIFNNLRIIDNTFEMLQKFRKPFVYASSQMANMNFSTYGLLKAIGERLTVALDGRVVHFWNVFGLERDPEKFHVISDFINMALSRGEILMRTNGEESRDFLHVDDCSEALEAVMLNFYEIGPDEELHIAKGEFTKIKSIADFIGRELNAKVTPGSKIDNLQKNRLNIPAPGISKYWQPKIGLEDGIKRVIESTLQEMKTTRR